MLVKLIEALLWLVRTVRTAASDSGLRGSLPHAPNLNPSPISDWAIDLCFG